MIKLGSLSLVKAALALLVTEFDENAGRSKHVSFSMYGHAGNPWAHETIRGSSRSLTLMIKRLASCENREVASQRHVIVTRVRTG
jgi:hypothetical protein